VKVCGFVLSSTENSEGEVQFGQKQLITAFAVNEQRLGRIAEGEKNTLESQLFELRDAITGEIRSGGW
jgi:hypothetical protein